MKSKFIALLFILFSIPICFAQKPDTSKLDSLFSLLDKKNKFMGSLTLMQNGKVLYAKSIGKDDIEDDKASSSQSKYRIGSLSKVFTAALVLKAAEEGKVNLAQSIERYFPTIPNANKITFSDLLSHRSGLYDFTNDPDYFNWNTLPKSESEMIAIISQGKTNFIPGTKADYCNSNYVLLSYLLQKIYNQTYAEILKEKILVPLGLKQTYAGAKIDITKDETYSYKFINSWQKEPETDVSIPIGAGAVVSNPYDLDLFIEKLFAGKVISKPSLLKMTAIKDDYGMGIFEFAILDKKAFGHTGAIDGFSSILLYFPADGLSLAIVSNGKNYDLGALVKAAVATSYNEAFDMPEFKTLNLTSEQLDKYIGIYSNPKIPVSFTVSSDGKSLVVSIPGQTPAKLAAVDNDIFEFAAYKARFEFVTAENKMILIQNGQKLEMIRK